MAYNYYVKINLILKSYYSYGIVRVNQPHKTKRFDGQYNFYDHYYYCIDDMNEVIPYTKFAQKERFMQIMQLTHEEFEILLVDNNQIGEKI